MHPPPIRVSRAEDLPVLGEVSRAADRLFEDVGLVLPPDDPEHALRSAGEVLVAGEPPVGFAAMDELDGRTHLDQLAVHPAFGGRGIGGALLAEVLARAGRRGSPAVTLTTFRDVPWNAPWYRRRGFVELPRSDWGPELRARWEKERGAGIAVAPRIVMIAWADPVPGGSGS
ncbi:GNAT family N-acetyltransferase [Actinoalloteichus sp. AHMU CJ021]|uniref:GNAT family N-acetyltransferase n=1 Tax=Actinoalloteichus sp. AHMU CJ021 TaxID=2072503 RepID=UPI000CA05E8D|nr:GNAT family N-acetyltransferase [Actinoalloteichus sp. AHMU CJ021]